MNITHLRYAIEIDKTRSISKAASNLYMGQPNLSRAIKELEETIGISIFIRSPKGISLTPQGEEFLKYAKRIVFSVDDCLATFNSELLKKQVLSISVPRASYISVAFTEFIKTIDSLIETEIYYKETNSLKAINNILHSNYRLGIIRFQNELEDYYIKLFKDKDLLYDPLFEFEHYLLMSKENPLSTKDDISIDDLNDQFEIAHSDNLSYQEAINDSKIAISSSLNQKHIYIFERGSQFDLLSNVPNTYMWVSPMPVRILEQFNLVQKKASHNTNVFKDVLICQRGYHLSELEMDFIEQLKCSLKSLCTI